MSNGGIGVPGPEDHYSTVSFYHLLDLALDLIHPHNRALPPLH